MRASTSPARLRRKPGDPSMKVFPPLCKRRRVRQARLVVVVLALFAIANLSSVNSPAQTSEQAAQIVQSLSEHSRTVVQRLSQLDQLPAEEWRFHSGDLAHGESTDLDDSSWKLVKPRMDAAKEAVWFRRTIEVPQSHHGYDLTGARIWFSFEANANGPI